MLTKQLREMERQANVVTTKKQSMKEKLELEVLRQMVYVNTQITQDELYLQSDAHMHEHLLKRLDRDTKTYVKELKSLLVPNKEYILNLAHPIIPYNEFDNFVQFLYDNMVYGEYKTEDEDFFYDKNTPGKIHKYCDAGRGTMTENKSEIIEFLHLTQFTFFVDNEGNTNINGILNEDTKINVILNKNIFETHLFSAISLFTI